jgi:hypothetical protein
LMQGGTTYRIEMKCAEPAALEPFLRVYDPYGRLAAESDDSGARSTARILFRPGPDRTFRIVAGSYRNRDAGPFSLEVTEEPPSLWDIFHGPSEWHNDQINTTDSAMFCSVASYDVKRPHADPEDILDQARDDLLGPLERGFVLEDESKIALGSHPGREMHLHPTTANGPAGRVPPPKLRLRMYVSASWIHRLIAVGPPKTIDGPDGTTFLNSFRFDK